MNHESPQVKTVECKQVKTQAKEDMERDGIIPATGDVDPDTEDEEEEEEEEEEDEEADEVQAKIHMFLIRV